MFGFTKREQVALKDYPDEWSLAQATYEGKPLFLRFKPNLLEAKDRSDYGFQIGIAIPLLKPTEEGLTTNEEAESLFALEDAVESTLTENGNAIFVLAITTNGMRELVFYTKDWKPEDYEQKVKDSVKYNEHKPQFMMQPDGNWDTYRQFVK